MKNYKRMNRKISHFAIVQLILSIFLMQTALPLISGNSDVLAESSQSCTKILNKAEEFYYNAKFDNAIELIRQCIKDPNLTKENRLRAYRILTRIFLAKNEKDKAEKVARKILKIDPAYKPTIEKEKPDYIKLISDLKAEQTPKKTVTQKPAEVKTNSKKWYWIGAGAVVVLGTTAIILSSGGNNNNQNNTLPEPPQFPTN